jgi:hypothetical protein
MPKKLSVNIVYTNRGILGIENQTRYSTDAILALVNELEVCLHAEALPYRPQGAVFCLVDWRHSRPPAYVRKYREDGGVERVLEKQYVVLRDDTAWDTIRIVPPELLFSNPLEALSWDGQFAPLALTEQLAQRFAFELGISLWDMQRMFAKKAAPMAQLPVMPIRGSKRRGGNTAVQRASRAEVNARNAYRRASNARWFAYSAERHLAAAQKNMSTLRPDLAELLSLRQQEMEYLYRRLIGVSQEISSLASDINQLDLTRKE